MKEYKNYGEKVKELVKTLKPKTQSIETTDEIVDLATEHVTEKVE